MKKWMLLSVIITSYTLCAQNIGIGTNTPQATLDVKGNQRIGGVSNYMTFDSASAKIEWKNAYIYAPGSQALMKHSAAADGLFYNNIGGGGKIEYRNATGNPVFYTSFVSGDGYFSNRLGIGNLTPQFPLSFSQGLGDKISLWSNSTNSYGFGIQGSLLQIHTDVSTADIAFGYGSSSSFSERARIINSGADGMELSGRLVLKNGTTDINNGAGAWLYKADNSDLLGFIGAQNNQNIGIYGGPAGWGFTYDAINSRVGIGIANPQHPLDINGRMRLSGTSPNTPGIWLNEAGIDRAFVGLQNNNQVGFYGNTGIGWGFTMNTITGALALNGNEGQSGQVLQSGGSGQQAFWSSSLNVLYNNMNEYSQIGTITIGPLSQSTIPGANNITVSLSKRSKLILSSSMDIVSTPCTGCGGSHAELIISINTNPLFVSGGIAESDISSGEKKTFVTSSKFITLNPGNYAINLILRNGNLSGPSITGSEGRLNIIILTE